MSCAATNIAATRVAAPIPRQRIAQSFGRAAGSYDAHAGLQRSVADTLLAGLDGLAVPARVLDLGCGTGYCSAGLRARYARADLYALDLAVPMLQASAARNIPGLQLLCADAGQLPFAAGAFDLVVSSLTIQWCANISALFRDLFRTLQPGGSAVLSTFGPATLAEVRAAWSAVDDSMHVNEFLPPDLLRAAADAAGFRCAVRSELCIRHYSSLRAVGAELKGIGAGNMNSGRRHGLVSRTAFLRAEQQFAAGLQPEGAPVTWEVLYLSLHKPCP